MKQFLLVFFTILGSSFIAIGGIIFLIYFIQFLAQHLPAYVIGELVAVVGVIMVSIAYPLLKKIKE